MKEKNGTEYQEVKEKKNTASTVALLVVLFILYFAIFAAIWLMTTWPNMDPVELIYNFSAPLTGTGDNMILDCVLKVLLPTLGVFGLTLLVVLLLKKRKTRKIALTSFMSTSIISVVIIFVVMLNWLDLPSYMSERKKESTFIQDNYVEPKEERLTFPDEKRNLIYIFMESTEVTFTDRSHGGAFDENLIPELEQLARDNEDFSGSDEKINGANMVKGTNWTVGSLFGHTSGLPLIVQMDKIGDRDENIFPDCKTLGDILYEQGYTNEFLMGSDASFGARETYFKNHGSYAIKDYKYIQENLFSKYEIEEDYHVFWGIEDKKLFTIAQDELLDLSSQDKPFNLSLLTVDTHFENGYICDECEEEYDDQYKNVYRCSSKRVSDFVSWYFNNSEIDSHVRDNTTIVISGDHLTMDADFCNDVDESYDRRMYCCYINSACKTQDPTNRRKFTVFDLYPTTLASLGVKIDGNRLALGANLFSNEKTLLEQYSITHINLEFYKRSQFMIDMFPLISKTDER